MPNHPAEQPAPATRRPAEPVNGASAVNGVSRAVTPAPAASGAAASNAGVSDSWLLALQEIQRQTSEAHAAYQHALADGHSAYLRASEATLSGMIAALDGSGAAAANRAPAMVPPRTATPVPAPAAIPDINSAVVANGAPVAIPWSAPPREITRHAAPAVPEPVDPVELVEPAAPAQPANVPDQLEQVVIGIVGELTGYPADVLDPDMELEHDLGIDSIKRVQILSRVRERVPDLPGLEPAQLAALRTIGEITAYLRRHGTSRQSSPAADLEGERYSANRV